MADQPWHELPPRVVDVLRPALPDIADEMIDAVRRVPAYSRPLEGQFGDGVRAGVRRRFTTSSPRSRPADRSRARMCTGRSVKARCAPAEVSTRC